MLKQILQANAAFCAILGAIFVFAGATAANFIGDPPVLLLQLLGVGSIAGAAMLFWTSTRSQPDRMIVLLISLGNALWVIATAVLLTAGLWITTTSGVVWSIGIAAFIGSCGALQWRLAPRRRL